MQILLLPLIFLPISCGILLLSGKIRADGNADRRFSLISVTAVSVAVWIFVLFCPEETFRLAEFSRSVSISFRLDGMGRFFAGTVAVLWPFAMLYTFAYLKQDPKRTRFSGFYMITYGSVIGIAAAANAMTMYVFYEILTFVTLPLITHTQTKEARRAGRFYLYYSLSGSSFALAGIVILTVLAGSTDFVAGGRVSAMTDLIGLSYLFTFFGFGVKAAVFPLCGWLPTASAAPTPTTALLHAVAVVKAGAFAILRMTAFNFTPSLLNGTKAQNIALGFIAFTVVYGSVMALKEQHWKRRFAYSTVSNLSYILFGILLCSQDGLEAGLLHFLFHSFAKISIFFCVGAVMETTGCHEIFALNGMGKKMPVLFTVYTLSGLSLIGMPLFAGFISKFYLVRAAWENGSVLAVIGMSAVLLSAVLTSVYVLSVSFRAFLREPNEFSLPFVEKAKEPEKNFLIPAGVFAGLSIAFGVCSEPLTRLLEALCGGVFA